MANKLYVAILDNTVVCYGNTLKSFHDEFVKREPGLRPYFNLRRDFEKNPLIEFEGKSGEKYILQEVFNHSKEN